ncbi:MAG: hypothetical protein R3F36_02265 [Candidatus Competibacteraceae bacterium]
MTSFESLVVECNINVFYDILKRQFFHGTVFIRESSRAQFGLFLGKNGDRLKNMTKKPTGTSQAPFPRSNGSGRILLAGSVYLALWAATFAGSSLLDSLGSMWPTCGFPGRVAFLSAAGVWLGRRAVGIACPRGAWRVVVVVGCGWRAVPVLGLATDTFAPCLRRRHSATAALGSRDPKFRHAQPFALFFPLP